MQAGRTTMARDEAHTTSVSGCGFGTFTRINVVIDNDVACYEYFMKERMRHGLISDYCFPQQAQQ